MGAPVRSARGGSRVPRMFHQIFDQMKKQLRQLDAWLAAGETHARGLGQEPADLLALRLAPDQFPLSRQVQIACDTLKLGAARLTGKTAPSHPDTEATIDELRARVRSTLEVLEGFGADDFADIAAREVTQPRWEGKVMTGHDYFLEHVIPNFYFHAVHVYALLRHHGVPLGKKDYLGTLTMRTP